MTEDSEKRLDDFIQKMVKEAGLEEPRPNFTEIVLSKIELSKKGSATVYRPPISRNGWVVGILILGFGIFFLWRRSDTNVGWLEKLGLDQIRQNHVFDSLSAVSVPDTLLYGLAVLAIFVYLQIYLMKDHWSKRSMV